MARRTRFGRIRALNMLNVIDGSIAPSLAGAWDHISLTQRNGGMAMAIFSRGSADHTQDNAELARRTASGGGFSNVVALFALVFSGWSFYETVWKADSLRLFVAPQIQYADPANGVFDVYGVPVTIANTGARAGVALAFQLDVENPRTGETKRYYSAEIGSWKAASRGDGAPFAPITVPGRESVTRQILFYPRAGETVDRLVATDAGEYAFTLTLLGAPVDRLPAPLQDADRAHSVSFTMMIDGVDYRAFNDGGTLSMRRPDYQPVVSE